MENAKNDGCDQLADILVKYMVCGSKKVGLMAIVPALVAGGILDKPRPGYLQPPGFDFGFGLPARE